MIFLLAPFTYSSFLHSEANPVVCAFYYSWYGPSGWGSPPGEGYAHEPLLGFYDSRTPSTVKQHDEWASSYGIDVFVVSWNRDWEDDLLKNDVLPNLENTSFAILYESLMSLEVTSADTSTWWGYFRNEKIDFDDPENRDNFVADFDYIADTYFNHPLYFKIDGRPIVYIYSASIFSGDYSSVIKQIRENARAKGFEIYLVGDVVYWHTPLLSADIIKQFDEINAYTMVIPLPDIATDFASKVIYKYGDWKLFADTIGVNFAPTVIAGYDEAEFLDRPTKDTVIAKDRSQFERFCSEVKKFISSSGLVFVTSFNEWHEGTEVEPSVGYGTDYLEVIRSEF